MRRGSKTLLLSLLMFFSLSSSAQQLGFTPESGFWWDAERSGSGYAVEIQDDFLFIAFYVYDAAGIPIWYTTGARLTGNALYQGVLNYSFGGPCIDCPYTEPTTLVGDAGPVTIEFLSESTALIKFQGEERFIERFNFILGQPLNQVLGEWQVVFDGSPDFGAGAFGGDVLVFEDIETDNLGTFADGCRPENMVDGFCSNLANSLLAAAAEYDQGNDEMLILMLDTLENNFYFYQFYEISLNKMKGVMFVYQVGNNPSGDGYIVKGYRSASRAFVQTGTGPSSTPSAADKNTASAAAQAMMRRQVDLKKATKSSEGAAKLQDLMPKIEQMQQRLLLKKAAAEAQQSQ